MSRAGGSPESVATDPGRAGGRSSGQGGQGLVLPPKAGLKLDPPERGSNPHTTPEVVGVPGTGGAEMCTGPSQGVP